MESLALHPELMDPTGRALLAELLARKEQIEREVDPRVRTLGACGLFAALAAESEELRAIDAAWSAVMAAELGRVEDPELRSDLGAQLARVEQLEAFRRSEAFWGSGSNLAGRFMATQRQGLARETRNKNQLFVLEQGPRRVLRWFWGDLQPETPGTQNKAVVTGACCLTAMDPLGRLWWYNVIGTAQETLQGPWCPEVLYSKVTCAAMPDKQFAETNTLFRREFAAFLASDQVPAEAAAWIPLFKDWAAEPSAPGPRLSELWAKLEPRLSPLATRAAARVQVDALEAAGNALLGDLLARCLAMEERVRLLDEAVSLFERDHSREIQAAGAFRAVECEAEDLKSRLQQAEERVAAQARQIQALSEYRDAFLQLTARKGGQ